TNIQAWGNNRITLFVPTGATTGNVVVTVGGVASNGVKFTLITTPYINDASPNTGGVGQQLNVDGGNFGSSQGTSTVTFNGTTATNIQAWGNNRITLFVPTGATTGNVVVTVGGVASNGVKFTLITTPYINDASPNTGGVGQQLNV